MMYTHENNSMTEMPYPNFTNTSEEISRKSSKGIRSALTRKTCFCYLLQTSQNKSAILQMWITVAGSPRFSISFAAAAAKLWPLSLSQLLLAFLCSRANGRDSSQDRVLSHAQAVAESERITRKQGRACFYGWAIQKSKVPMPRSPINR